LWHVGGGNFRKGVGYLLNVWKEFRVDEVYRADALGVLSNTVRWGAGLLLSSVGVDKFKQVSLLDNSPLLELLEETLPCEKIQDSLDAGLLDALSITASGYGSGQSVTFYQGKKSLSPWRRARRVGVAAQIEIQHLLASSAIPFIFPAVKINREYFGDGSMRQIAPISSALHLGANRVLVIGTGQHGEEGNNRNHLGEYPSLAQIAGHALNSIFLDSIEVDLERLKRINHTLSLIPEAQRQRVNLHHVEVLVITPSESIEKIAEQYATRLPWTIRLLLRAIGAMRRSGANLVSYLLFDKSYCRALIALGYADAMQRQDEILAFMVQQESAPDAVFPQ
jgi:NTE family protein